MQFILNWTLIQYFFSLQYRNELNTYIYNLIYRGDNTEESISLWQNHLGTLWYWEKTWIRIHLEGLGAMCVFSTPFGKVVLLQGTSENKIKTPNKRKQEISWNEQNVSIKPIYLGIKELICILDSLSSIVNL